MTVHEAYKTLTDVSWGDDNHAVAGETVTNLPAESIDWLLAGGHIEPVKNVQSKETKPLVNKETE